MIFVVPIGSQGRSGKLRFVIVKEGKGLCRDALCRCRCHEGLHLCFDTVYVTVHDLPAILQVLQKSQNRILQNVVHVGDLGLSVKLSEKYRQFRIGGVIIILLRVGI